MITMNDVKKEIINIYQLSPMQEGMLFHSIKEPETNTYFRQVMLSVSGTLDRVLFEKSFELLVDRHDSLRTVFLYDKVEQPLQVVLKKQKSEISFLDISGLRDEERDSFLEDYLRKDREKVFNLTKDVLIRISVIKTGARECKLLWSFHHILMDGWCTGVLLNDLFEIYRSLKFNIHANLEELRPYTNYVKWLEKRDKSEALSYWKEYLDSYSQQATVPKYKLQDDSLKYLQAEYDFTINSCITKRLDSLAKGCKVSMNTIFQTLWGILLQKYNNTGDVVFGSVVSGRPTDLIGVDRIVGLFINTIPVRVKSESGESFTEVLARMQKAALESENHSYFPLYEIHANTELKQELFDHIIAFENYPMGKDWAFSKDTYGIGFCVDGFEMYQKTNYSFNIIVTPGTDIKVRLIYNANFFDEYIIRNIEKHFNNAMYAVLDNPQIEIGKIDILSDEEKSLTLNGFNSRKALYPHQKTIHELFEEVVKRFKDRTAAKIEESGLTYGELNNRANQIAKVLKENGVGRESIVAIMMYPSLDMICSILGILKAGGAYLPIDPDYPDKRISFMLEDSGAKVLLTEPGLISKVTFSGTIVDVQNQNIYSEHCENPEHINKPSDLAYIIYTSGTTGKPKGAMIEHRNVVSLMCNDGMEFSFDENDVWTMFHSFCFDFSVWEMYGALLFGGRLVVVPKQVARDTSGFLKLLKEEKATVLNQTPSAFYNLANEELLFKDKELGIRYIIFGGESLKPMLLKEWRSKYPETRLINMYGITETTVHVTFKEITEYEIDLNISNIGKPIPTLTNYVMDKNLRLLPVGVPGELCVGGEGVCRGYLKRPELTSEKFVMNINYNPQERLYRSGDLVRMFPDGDMEYLGRIDHQVKIRGFRVELGDIEAKLLNHPEISETIVVCHEDSAGGKYLCAYIVSRIELTAEELREHSLIGLPSYMVPSRFIRLQKMPMNSNGKVDRKALPKPSGDIVTGTSYAVPENEDEKKLVSIWASVLEMNAESLGVMHNFFTLGGDSIKAIRLISLTNKYFKSNFQLKDLYELQTIKEFASKLLSRESGTVDDKLEKARIEIEKLKKDILGDQDQLAGIPADFEDLYPMSDIEFGMVYYSIKNPEAAIYHDQSSYRLYESSFNKDAFESAVSYMSEKHPILRTSFNLKDFKQPVQIIHKSIAADMEYFDLRENDGEDSKAYIENCLLSDRKMPFDINKAPLWRFKVFYLKNHRICLVFICHHAILDGWSVACFMTELVNIYLKYKNGENVEVQKLKLDYKDYVIEQAAVKGRKDIVDYWKKELDGYKRFTFPPRISWEGINNSESKVLVTKLKTELIDKVKNTAFKYGTSLKTLCFAAYLCMLNTIGSDDEVVAGLVEHNRLIREDGEKVLGCFLNTVPVRVMFKKGMSWEELVKSVTDKLTELKLYEKFSLHEVLKATGEGMKDENPIFDTFFNYVDFYVYDKSENKGIIENIADMGGFEKSNAALDFTVSVTSGYVGIKTSYKTSMFEDTQIRSYTTLFINILEELASNPQAVICKEKIIPAEEKRRLLIDFNGTFRAYDSSKTICKLFEEQVIKTPNATSLVFGNRQVSYTELDEASSHLARSLASLGISRGSVVGIMVGRSVEMVECILGVLKAGAAYLPIDPEFPSERIKYMLQDSGAKLLLTQSGLSGKLDVDIKSILIEDLATETKNEGEPHEKASAEDLAYVIYTSGSTGRPKGVMIEHRGVVNFIKGMIDAIGFSADKTILALTTISFDIFVLEVLLPLTIGMKVVIANEEEQKDPELINRMISENSIDMLQITPARLQMLMTNKNCVSSMGRLKEVMVGGEPFPQGLLEALKDITSARIYNMYGPTETTVWSSIKELTGEKKILIGKPIANTRMYILNENGGLQPVCSVGELCIGGDGVARGYINAFAMTAERFVPDLQDCNCKMYKTGDMARWLPDGNIEFMGRRDEQVKIRGFRIELSEIEARLESYSSIHNAVVAAKSDKEGIRFLCAYYISDSVVDLTEIKKHLSLELPEYMIPTYFVRMDKFPMTPNGKVDRKLLPEPDNSLRAEKFMLPENETEKRLLSIWQDVLGISNLSTSSNFFELGGHSLKAAILIARINRDFNVNIPLRSIFLCPTIIKLAQNINNAGHSEVIRVESSPKSGYYPLTSEQRRVYLAGQTEEDGIAYNMPGAMIIEGILDIKRFEETFKCLIGRHEAYRTSITFENGGLVQKVNDNIDFKVAIIEKGDGSLDAIIDNFIRPFDLRKAPLLRVGLVKLDKDRYLMLFDVHHIISDGVSAGILIKEFASLYNGNKLPEVKLQYRDYAVWQEKVFTDSHSCESVIANQKQYWKDTFAGGIPLLNLPVDYPRKSQRSFEGDRIIQRTGTGIVSGITRLANETGATTFMVMFAAYGILLSKLSGQNDIVIGTPMAGRSQADLQETIGMFVNTLPIKLGINEGQSVVEIIKYVKEVAIKAFENQSCRIEEIVEMYESAKHPGRNPLFDTMFLLQNVDIGKIDIEGLKFKPYVFKTRVSKLDLSLEIIQEDSDMVLVLEYCTKLFKADTIQRILQDYIKVLEFMVRNSSMELSSLKLMDRYHVRKSVISKDLDFNF